MLSYTTERPVIIYRIEIICRRYKSTLKRSTQAIWCHSAKESQATHSIICSSTSSLSSSASGGSSLLHVGPTFDMSVALSQIASTFSPFGCRFLCPSRVITCIKKKVIFQGFSHATSIPRTRTWDDVTWSHSSAQRSNVPTA